MLQNYLTLLQQSRQMLHVSYVLPIDGLNLSSCHYTYEEYNVTIVPACIC